MRNRYQIIFIDNTTKKERMEVIHGLDLIELAERFYSIYPKETEIVNIKNVGKGW